MYAYADCRLMDYLPSVIAAATMKYVIGEIEPCDEREYQNQLMTALQTSMVRLDLHYMRLNI